ncbi:MAG: 3',5'-cyclic-AMP phosphodiesterase [Gammaproteobacteria bacterium]|nr:3',5'-cyclic-AMP phosphodiesterase [Gammaproteobacteria bacterium]
MFASKSSISVLHITDAHIMGKPDAKLLGINTAYYFNAVLYLALQSPKSFDFCLLTGDLAQEPCQASYHYLLNRMETCGIPTLCLPGNHDDFALMQAIINTELVNCNKLKMLGNWLFIGLNSQIIGSEGGHLAESELSFMEKSLRQHPHLHALIAVHHHCLPTGSEWMDTMIINNNDDLFAIVRRFPQVKAVINGHTHQELEHNAHGVQLLTTPSTCFQFKPNNQNFMLDDLSPGYRWLELYPDGALITSVERINEPLIGLQKNIRGY